MFKKICMLILVFFSANVWAKTVTIRSANHEIVPWEIATKDDGYTQLLGEYDPKKFIVYVAPSHNGKPSDTITLDCNAGDGNGYQTHQVPAGTMIICYPDFKDFIPIYIDHFRNGAEGTFTYEPYDSKKK